MKLALRSLYWKLSLAFVLVAFITAALLAVFMRVTTSNRLGQLIIDQQTSQMEAVLASYFAINNSWEGVEQNWLTIEVQTLPMPMAMDLPGQPAQGMMHQAGRERRSLFALADAEGRVIVGGGQNFPAGSSRSKAELEAGTPILVNGKQVGTLLTASRSFGLNAEEARFLLRTNRALIYAALIGIVVAMLIGIFLARTFTRPLRDLNQAAQKIGAGQLEQEVPVRSQDEIGQLAGAFNRMSREIARVNQQRRQMTADIAHDLRTPLQVIAGYVEAMRDGVLQPTPERMDLITSEIERLQRMVSDLRTLSQADAGELPLHTQAIEPASLLQAAAARFQHQASQSQVALTAEAPGGLPALQVDEARLSQVLDNLVSNALRYTPAGGRIRLSARGLPGRVELKVQDSGSGIAPEEIGLIFNRFHRSDRSRHAEDGESGLGLSIVKALVEAHGGTVRAESAPGEGTAMIIELPAAQG